MVTLGNFFFRHRNYLFPFFYAMMFVPSPRVTQDYKIMLILGLLVVLIGQSIRFTTIGLVYIVRGGRNRRIYADGLVTEGLFSHCRNPMYVGNILMILGMGILSNSYFYLLVMVPFFVFVYQAIVRAEENYLRGQYGKSFDEYCSHVNRWIPNFKGLSETLSGQKFDFKKMIYKEYNTTYVWICGAILVILFNLYLIDGKEYYLENRLKFLMVFAVATVGYLTVRFFKKRNQRLKKSNKQKLA